MENKLIRGGVVLYYNKRAIVMQNNVGNHYSKTTIIGYIYEGVTENPYCAQLSEKEYVDIRTIRTVDVASLTLTDESLSLEQINVIDKCLSLSVGRLVMEFVNDKVQSINKLTDLISITTDGYNNKIYKTILKRERRVLINYLDSLNIDKRIVLEPSILDEEECEND